MQGLRAQSIHKEKPVSKEAVKQVIDRMTNDQAFRRQVLSDAEGALRGYDLTSDEKLSLTSPDAPGKATGLDERKSKLRRDP